MKILSLITLMSFQTCKTSIHVRNTNEYIFVEIQEQRNWHV